MDGFLDVSKALWKGLYSRRDCIRQHITWLHARACKYNISALGTYFGCEGVKRTYLDLT